MSIKDDLLAAIPNLRAFAISLCGRNARAAHHHRQTDEHVLELAVRLHGHDFRAVALDEGRLNRVR